MEMLQHLQPLGHILKFIGPIEVEKNTKYISISKYIKVMSVESEAYWQTPVKWLAERTLIAGILIYFNHFNICVCVAGN